VVDTYLEIIIRSFMSYPCSGGAPSAGEWHMESFALTDFSGSDHFPCLLVWFQISLFRSTVGIIDDGCCSGAQVL
jgi:hypothetical protein